MIRRIHRPSFVAMIVCLAVWFMAWAVYAASVADIPLVDRNGTAQATVSGINWAILSSPTIDGTSGILDQGTNATTDSSGVLRIETSIDTTATHMVILTDSNGTAGVQSNAHVGSYTFSALLALLGMSPDAWDFGEVEVGQNATKVFTGHNYGNANLTSMLAQIVADTSDSYTLTADTCTGSPLVPDDDCSLTVMFEPDAAGVKNATLSIASNDAASPFELPLTGTGVGGGDDYSDILLFWTCESWSSTSGDYPSGLTWATDDTLPSLSTNAAVTGTYGIDGTNGWRTARIAPSPGTRFNTSAGRVGYWLNKLESTASLFGIEYVIDSNNAVKVGVDSAAQGNKLLFTNRVSGTSNYHQSTNGVTSNNTWYFIEVAWTGTTATFYIDGESAGSATIAARPSDEGASPVMWLMGPAPGNPGQYRDLIMISSDPTRNLYALRNLTASPR